MTNTKKRNEFLSSWTLLNAQQRFNQFTIKKIEEKERRRFDEVVQLKKKKEDSQQVSKIP